MSKNGLYKMSKTNIKVGFGHLRTMFRRQVERFANLSLCSSDRERFQKLVVYPLLHKDSRAGAANLTHIVAIIA